MPGRIRDEDVTLVKERADLAEVIGDHVTLRNAGGGNLKGLCPFHDEKTPSFSVRPSLGYFHCFGCGESGDVISFVMKIDHLTFAESVERLAARVGVQLRYDDSGGPATPSGQRARLVAAHRAAAEFYAEQLLTPDAVTARRFLAERGFDRDAAARFGVGFAPRGWDELAKHLRGRGYTVDELVTAGLARKGERGPMDWFRARLVWPIREITGDVVGFGARRLFDDDRIGAKYVNTPETPIYKKSQVLYGLDLAKKEIARARQAVVVEGYTDVMAAHLSGVETTVATCGTSFGSDHIKVLRRLLVDDGEFAGEVVFTFDGDSAGQKAALRAFQEDQRFVTQTFVAVEPSGMDPCELRQHKGEAAVRDLVASRVPLFEFAIRSALARHDLDIPEGRVAALRAAAPIVASIRDRALRPEYARRLAGWLGMDDESVLRAVAHAARGEGRGASRDGGRPAERTAEPTTDAAGAPGHMDDRPRYELPDPRHPVVAVEREVLKVALQAPLLLQDFDALEQSSFVVPTHVAVRDAVLTAGGVAAVVDGSIAPGEPWIEAVSRAADDDSLRSAVTALAVEPVRADGEIDARYAVSVLARLREHDVDRRAADLHSRLQRLDPAAEEYQRVFTDLVALEQLRREIREQAAGVL